MTRKNVLHHVGRLRALVHSQHVVGGVVVRQDASRLIGHASVSAELIHFFNDDIGF